VFGDSAEDEAVPVEVDVTEKKKISAIEQIAKDREASKDKNNRKDYWIKPGIIVKVMSKIQGGKYYKLKGKIVNVTDKYVADVNMLDSGDVMRIDQNLLETVIPPEGGRALIVNGAYRGEEAVLISLDIDKFWYALFEKLFELKSTHFVCSVPAVEYEDFCKLDVDSK